jgi:DNA-binding beta-propeller fold protein YncE
MPLGRGIGPSCAYLREFGSPGGGNGQFNVPDGVALDALGNVYVADSFNNRVQKFTPYGIYLGQWGTLGPGLGMLYRPVGIDVGPDGYVYVAESNNARVQVFTTDGVFVRVAHTSCRAPKTASSRSKAVRYRTAQQFSQPVRQGSGERRDSHLSVVRPSNI